MKNLLHFINIAIQIVTLAHEPLQNSSVACEKVLEAHKMLTKNNSKSTGGCEKKKILKAP